MNDIRAFSFLAKKIMLSLLLPIISAMPPPLPQHPGFIVQVTRGLPKYECYDFFDGELVYCKVDDLSILQDKEMIVIDHWWNFNMYTQACQRNAPWHLSSVNGKRLPDAKYSYDNVQAETTVYVVDTWVDTEHPDFQGRASRGPAFESGSGSHGTHVAGLVASSSFGVNKRAKIVSVQVLNGAGTGPWSSILAGLEWISRRSRYGSVINISIGGGKSAPIDAAINAFTRHGWKIVVAAGNSQVDACTTSPAGAQGAITVGAFDVNYAFTSFSNYGKCVDIQAPGKDILSLYPGDRAAYNSGTSMAAPIVAGIWSLNPSLTAEELKKQFSQQWDLQRLPEATTNRVAYVKNLGCGGAGFVVQ